MNLQAPCRPEWMSSLVAYAFRVGNPTLGRHPLLLPCIFNIQTPGPRPRDDLLRVNIVGRIARVEALLCLPCQVMINPSPSNHVLAIVKKPFFRCDDICSGLRLLIIATEPCAAAASSTLPPQLPSPTNTHSPIRHPKYKGIHISAIKTMQISASLAEGDYDSATSLWIAQARHDCLPSPSFRDLALPLKISSPARTGSAPPHARESHVFIKLPVNRREVGLLHAG